jgi:hypothetical protein
MPFSPDPPRLSFALGEAIARRGYARPQAVSDLVRCWEQAVGPQIAAATRPLRIMRGTLQVEVASAPLLAEITHFQQSDILARLQSQSAHLRIKALKLRLKGLG